MSGMGEVEELTYKAEGIEWAANDKHYKQDSIIYNLDFMWYI